MKRSLMRWLPGVGAAVLLLAAIGVSWQIFAGQAQIFFLPTPQRIGERLASEWFSGDIRTLYLSEAALNAIGQSFATAATAWLIALVIGIAVGVLIGSFKSVEQFTNVPFLLLRSIPGVALIPIFIAILGIGNDMRVAVVTFGCIWPILLNTAAGVSQIEPRYIDVSKVARQSRAARLFSVLLPAIFPKVFAGMRVALALSLILTIATEMLAGSGGLGAVAMRYQSTFDVPGLWATLAILAACGLLLNLVIVVTEDRVLRWHKKWRSQND